MKYKFQYITWFNNPENLQTGECLLGTEVSSGNKVPLAMYEMPSIYFGVCTVILASEDKTNIYMRTYDNSLKVNTRGKK